MFARRLSVPLLLALGTIALADGPADNIPAKVRPVPPLGIELPKADAEELQAGLAELQTVVKQIGKHDLLPDVEIYEKAVRYAITYREVFDKNGIPAVKKVLKEGLERANLLKDGKHPWTAKTGYVIRGYRSKIDGSPQPYGLFVPKEYEFKSGARHRLDFWWHGRGETLSEVNFMANPQGASGIIPVPGQFILYPYGRYCCANKFAGEVDSFECLDHAKKFYRIDESRLVARGFSMGGAACWQYAVHFPTFWCAAAPGAGFAETPDFLRVFQKEDTSDAPWYEKKLWHMYDSTDYALNIFDLPTVAYSGENDSQKQAADIMAKAMEKEGLKLVHIIGPKTGHSYEKGARIEVNNLIDDIVAKGEPKERKEIKFTTYTLRYNQCGPITIEGLGKHWERARVISERKGDDLRVTTENISSMFISNSGPRGKQIYTIDGQEFQFPSIDEKTISNFGFGLKNGKWNLGVPIDSGLKKPGLQGPIDDAFMNTFLMVSPGGKPMQAQVGDWASAEMKHATEHWRQQFRGDVPIKKDLDVTDDDILFNNLILWGDPASNTVLAKIANKLPVKWTEQGIVLGDQTYNGATHVPVLIYPNPLNPKKYVVLNSGFTFREYDYLNNARQVSKLPDYAIIDITTPPNSRYPGKVVRAGFFGEKWELQPNDGK